MIHTRFISFGRWLNSFYAGLASLLCLLLLLSGNATAQLCTSAATSTTLTSLLNGGLDYDNQYDNITSVSINGTSRTSGRDANSAASLGTTVSLVAGSTYTIEIKVIGGYLPTPEYNVKLWFDWNNNGSYEAPGEEVNLNWQDCIDPEGDKEFTFNGSVTVPSSAVTSTNARMRVGLDYYNANPLTVSANMNDNRRSGALPCGYKDISNENNSQYVGNRVGDFEDYTLAVSAPSGGSGTVGGALPADGFYATLKKKLDGSTYVVKNDLSFIYDEAYQVPNTATLNYKVYNYKREVVAAFSTPTIARKFGKNYITATIGGGLVAGNVYELEVSNDKNERFYLKFKYQP